MTTVYLDTSVAMNEAFLKSPYSEAFFKACAILQYSVVIPQIVVDELKGNYPKKLKEKMDAFQKSKKELNKLLDVDAPAIILTDAVKEFEEWLEDLIEEHGIKVVPYPDIPAKELVEQSYQAKKPFKESGEGHKDYIVWKTILNNILVGQTTPPHIFLTNNTKDFCELDPVDAPVLHSDLAGQIDNLAHRPSIYTSIKAAFDAQLSPNLEGITLNDIPDFGADEISEIVEKSLLDDLPSRTLYGLEGVPFSNEITISSIGAHSIDSVTLKKVEDEVIVNVSGTVEVEVDGFIDKSAYYMSEHLEESNMYVVDGDWNDHVMFVSTTVDTTFDMTIFYSTQSGEVTGTEISLPQEIEDEWPYK
jgi:hypothetical protein